MKKIIAKVLAAASVVSAIAACPVMAGDVSTQGVTHPCLHENMHYSFENADSNCSDASSSGLDGHFRQAYKIGYCAECDYVERSSSTITILESHTPVVTERVYVRDKNGNIVNVINYIDCADCGAHISP